MLFENKQFIREPLASRMRPRSLAEFIGHAHLLAPQKPLYQAITEGVLHSMILWGPPGTGKTTLAHLLAHKTEAHVETLSAVLAGVKDIRAVVERAALRTTPTILFVDEVHRFNKSQQDAFLPCIEQGLITFIGATTENPSFELNNALLSRTRVYVLKALTHEELRATLKQALEDKERGLGYLTIDFKESLQDELIMAADGDARRLLNLIEVLADFAKDQHLTVTEKLLADVVHTRVRRFDKGGDLFHDQISALHKAVRGSAPDAALYWLCRMLDAGCDPFYIARRTIRMACEDIGNADPRALNLALDAWQVQERLGSPEGELAIAQAILYMACAAKSNAVYTAFNAAMMDVKKSASLDVPLHLRNAPTVLMKELGYAKTYRYAHDEPDAYAAGEHYFPEDKAAVQYYYPVDRGLEIKIKEKLQWLKHKDKEVV